MYRFMIGRATKWRNSAMAMGGSVNANSDLRHVTIGVNNIGTTNRCPCLFTLNRSESPRKLTTILAPSAVSSSTCFVAPTSSSAPAVPNFQPTLYTLFSSICRMKCPFNPLAANPTLKSHLTAFLPNACVAPVDIDDTGPTFHVKCPLVCANSWR